MKPLTAAALGACAALFLAGSFAWAAGPERLTFRTQGFTLAPLELQEGELPGQSLMLFLPASAGFAPNVNVQLQPYAGTLEEYLALSKKQFQAAKLTLHGEPSATRGAITFEYSGPLQGKDLHWYGKAFKVGGRIYLATATADASQWEAVGPRLKASVDSFAALKR